MIIDFVKFVINDFFTDWKKSLRSIFNYLIPFSINFLIVYFVGTKDIGLCFVITLAMTQAYSSVSESAKIVLEKLIAPFQQLDDHINALHSYKEETEQKIEELENKIEELENKIEELEEKS